MRLSFICIFLLFCHASLFAQTTITGRVVNHNDKKPIANASIFLSNTTIGNESAKDGRFILKNVKSGKYQIIVSVVGFKTYNENIVANDNLINLHDIELVPEVKTLKEVSIRYKADPDRELYLKWFREQFIGTSELASDCVLINPEVLDFEYDKSKYTLTASSYDFLKIENKDLGYRLKYLVKDFSYCNNPTLKHPLHYQGFVLFEEMKGSAGQEKRWKRNRQDAYQGSEMHFFRSLVSNRLNEEGFRVLQWAIYNNPERPADSVIESKIKSFTKLKSADSKKYSDSLRFWEKKKDLKKVIETLMDFPLNEEEIVKLTDQKDMYALGCDMDNLHITYNKDMHFSKKGFIYHLDEPSNRETSVISFSNPFAFFDNNGIVLNINSISLSGVWARNRVAELLPYDYESEAISPALVQEDTLKPPSKVFYKPDTLEGRLLKYARYSDSLTSNYAAEKLYLQLDKSDYAVGDTIWLKAYLFNAASHSLSSHSGLLHIALVNDSNKIVKQALLQLKNGISWGNIGLSAKEFNTGDYTLTAYTNWMMNFGQDVFFRKKIRIASINENAWLINSKIDQGKDLINAKLQIAGVDKTPYADSVLRLEITEGRKKVYNQPIKTDHGGLLDFKFSPPTKTNNLNIRLVNKDNTKSAVIPISINRPENTDVQFLAEGGDLIAGIKAHIGFKAVGEDGKGADIKGQIVDATGKQVTNFSSTYKGMGSFDLMPDDNATYTAKVELPGGLVKDYPLPVVKRSGTVLQVKNSFKSDSVEVNISVTPDIIQFNKNYFLIGKARGVICYAATMTFSKNTIHRLISKSLFPSGITHFILSSTDGKPLNERLVFINRDDDLNIKVDPDELTYTTRDSIAFHVNVNKPNGDPVEGSFSMAVTDDAQIKPDSINADNILTRMLLTSDLKGYIESPGYYFQDNTVSFNALDNLLLTQGWVSYEPVEGKTSIPVEKEYTVNGNVKNVFNKPVKGTHVLLLSKSPAILMDTVTNIEGKFTFDHFPRVDTAMFVLKAVNKSGKSFNVGIAPEETPLPQFKLPSFPQPTPWYVNSDSSFMHLADNNIAYQNLRGYTPDGKHHLREVVIKAKKTVKDSQNLNGAGNADIVLDEKDMETAKKKTWLDLLRENVRTFNKGDIGGATWFFINDIEDSVEVTPGSAPSPYHKWYLVDNKPMKIYVDGLSVTKIYRPSPFELFSYAGEFNTITDYLTSHFAEDLKGIEVNYTTKYAMKYVSSYWVPYIRPYSVAFVEITTRAGHGPIIANTPGMYLYKPLAITWPAQFYKPKYNVKDTLHMPDYRSTIDWEPNIVTDENGKATVSFYAADKPSTYTIIMEGTDANGYIGYKRQKLVIRQKKIEAKSK
jgi:hypothetical protein